MGADNMAREACLLAEYRVHQMLGRLPPECTSLPCCELLTVIKLIQSESSIFSCLQIHYEAFSWQHRPQWSSVRFHRPKQNTFQTDHWWSVYSFPFFRRYRIKYQIFSPMLPMLILRSPKGPQAIAVAVWTEGDFWIESRVIAASTQ